MSKYSLANIEKHWSAKVSQFRQQHPLSRDIMSQVLAAMSDTAILLEGRRKLESNCAYLLLAKAFNHVASTNLLLERGLMVDAALAARNGIETLLLLELLSKRLDLCPKWVAGEEFKPGYVRKQLQGLPKVTTGALVIETPGETYDDIRFVYDWLSRITHANLESLNHATSQTAADHYQIYVGGAHLPAVITAISKALGSTCTRCLMTCLAVHQPAALQGSVSQFKRIESALRALKSDALTKESDENAPN